MISKSAKVLKWVKWLWCSLTSVSHAMHSCIKPKFLFSVVSLFLKQFSTLPDKSVWSEDIFKVTLNPNKNNSKNYTQNILCLKWCFNKLKVSYFKKVCLFPLVGRFAFYLCIIIYLYGDLAIYAAAVPKSLRDLAWWAFEFIVMELKESKGERYSIGLIVNVF